MIGFNKPHFTGKETEYILQAVTRKHISGNGYFTRKCHKFFCDRYKFPSCLLTTSCTDALEMAALLLEIKPGDEIILPSYTFVSSANAFMLRGATLRFADSLPNHPNIDPKCIHELINPNTKAIVVVHYGGVACQMDEIKKLASDHAIHLIEDAAHSIDSYYRDQPLGSFGDLSTFSFHETKNISCGEGGMLVINDPGLAARGEIIWEKGTNRAAFFRGEIDKYGWVELGSSFLPSDIIAAFLYAQLESLDTIQSRRTTIWDMYHQGLKSLAQQGRFLIPPIPDYATNNGHQFYLIMPSFKERSELISHLKESGIQAVFHYQSLHKSAYFSHKHDGRALPNADRFTDCLLRLPFYFGLKEEQIDQIILEIKEFYGARSH